MTGLTIGFSTSSPQSSVAIFSNLDELIWFGGEVAPNAASGALVRLLDLGLQEAGLALADATRFVADLGPGSFTGVRVGIVFAKTMAMGTGALVAGASAFDLIAADRTVYVPSRKGEVFVRALAGEVSRMAAPPVDATGYQYGMDGAFPHAAKFAGLLAGLNYMNPEQLVPAYLSEPSISLPKKPFGVASA